MTNATWRPERDIEIVAGTPPGGGQDRPARALIGIFDKLRLIDRPIGLVNMPGKGGGAAWDHIRAHPGDAHRLAINSPPLLTNRIIGVSDYDHADLTPIATLYTEYVAFVVPAASALDSAAALRDRLGADPASVTVALATALGTSNHIALAAIARQAGGDPRALRIRVFDSARYAVADVLDGHAQVAAVTAVSAAPELADGRLRALAVTAPERLAGAFAAAPTWAELGIDCVIGTWRGVIAPAGLTAAQIAFWESRFEQATRDPGWHAELARQYWVACFLGAADTRAFLDEERARLEEALERLRPDEG
jgi:putative tricarboxylic transport membrane protein